MTFSRASTLTPQICNFLSGRYQRVVLNVQNSGWRLIEAGVPQGSIGPLFFLIFINNLHDELESQTKIFADDTSLFSLVVDNNQSANLTETWIEYVSGPINGRYLSFQIHLSKQLKSIFLGKLALSIHLSFHLMIWKSLGVISRSI